MLRFVVWFVKYGNAGQTEAETYVEQHHELQGLQEIQILHEEVDSVTGEMHSGESLSEGLLDKFLSSFMGEGGSDLAPPRRLRASITRVDDELEDVTAGVTHPEEPPQGHDMIPTADNGVVVDFDVVGEAFPEEGNKYHPEEPPLEGNGMSPTADNVVVVDFDFMNEALQGLRDEILVYAPDIMFYVGIVPDEPLQGMKRKS